MRLIRLGLLVPIGKATRMNLPNRIVDKCHKSNIQIIEINIDKDIESQGPFDFVLHKVLDFYNEHKDEPEIARWKIDKFVSYTKAYPETIIIDNMDFCWRLTNRKLMIDLIEHCIFKTGNRSVFLPKTLDITENITDLDLETTVIENKIQFPVVVKPHSAYFDDGSHLMSLVFNHEGLKDFKKPYLVQEFCDHGAVLYKVFVIGNKYHICERPSVKNLVVEDSLEINCKQPETNIEFDSFNISKLGQCFNKVLHSEDPNHQTWFSSDQKSSLLDKEIIEEIILRIKKYSGLNLYGFDILMEEHTGNYALIDINQFPSYKGIDSSHFAYDLVELLETL
eukprot:TCONS_00069279-protein